MSFSSHRKLTAWLGLLAIWLAVVMPVVSQNIQRNHNQELSFSICSPGEPSAILTVALDSDTASHAQHDLSACDYCGLLAQHAPIPAIVAYQGDTTPWSSPEVQAPPSTPLLAPLYAAAHSRAPPLLLS